MKSLGAYSFCPSPSSLLGEGAFASVYRGVEAASGRAVAVKTLHPRNVKRDELDLVRSIDSDFVVRIHALFEEASEFFVVMELCDGTLLSHLERRLERGAGPLRETNLRTIVRCLARGLQAIHRHGVIHRDLKPENVLVCYAPSSGDRSTEEDIIALAKIADFGSSRLSNDEEGRRPPGLAGTPLYMAPEVGANVLQASDYDGSVDAWSLGCLLFHASQGEAPFDEARLCKLFLATATGNFAAYRPPDIAHSTPQPLQDIIRSLLQLDPSLRPTADELEVQSRSFAPLDEEEAMEEAESGDRSLVRVHSEASGQFSWRHFLIKNILTYFRDNIL